MNKYIKDNLSNGLNVITVPNKNTKAVTVLVMVKTGSRYESKEINGLSHFLEHMMFKGTKKRPDTLSLSTELDSVGAEFNAFTSKEFTGYWIKVKSDKLELALDVLSDMVINSKFEQKEIDKERGVIIEEMNMYKANPMMRIEDVFETCVYGDNSAGWEVIGTEKNIKNLNRDDFVKYFKKQYNSNNMSVILAGDLSRYDKKIVIKYFKDLEEKTPIKKEKIESKQKKQKILIENKESDQINLSLGVRTFPVGDKREYALKLMQVILGGSMSSRLFSEIREKRGLAYYVRTQTESYPDSGYITTEAGLRIKGAKEAIGIIIKEYEKLKEESVSEKELERAKELIKGKLFLNLENSESVANFYARQTVVREEIISPKEFLAKIDKVSAKDILEVANDIFKNDRLNLAILGPINKDKELEEIFKFK
ncbi:insulinase family protein [bacterium]|nr:insulinase family protein [bacterium]